MNIVVDTFKASSRMIFELCDLLLFSFIYVTSSKSADEVIIIHNDFMNTCSSCYNNICYEVGWKFVEVVTFAQLFYSKTLVPSFHKYTNYYFRNEVVLIKDGDEIAHFKNMDVFNKHDVLIEYDFLLDTNYELNDVKKNYTTICDNGNAHVANDLEHVCNINFIVFQLTFDGKKYDINLKEPFNFFIKNNTLKYPFFRWYMKKVYDVGLTDEFKINYMTQDMSINEIHSPFFIKFNMDSITSFSSGVPKLNVNNKPVLYIDTNLDIDHIVDDGSSGTNHNTGTNTSIEDECAERMYNRFDNCDKLKTQ